MGFIRRWSRWVKHSILRVSWDFPWFGPVISTVVIAMLVNLFYDWLLELGGLGGAFVAIMAMAATAVVFAGSYYVFTRRKYRPGEVEGKGKPYKRKGLIVLVSNPDTVRKAMEYHQDTLAYCWLITTKEVEKRGTVDRIKSLATPQVHFEERRLEDEYDAEECYQVIRGILQHDLERFGLTPEEVICDITGGTKPMTMGMILACVEKGYPVEHVPAVYDEELKALRPLEPFEIRYEIHPAEPTRIEKE
ncbi:MAG TPA: hypothetical protein ENG33_06865 [Chloroflexi bacterium]|nr:hypothetical protein [Chloroflexota bacterium]